MSKAVDVKYPAGHTSHQNWSPTELHCPWCGRLAVWEEDSQGDYYYGPMSLCTACGASFNLCNSDTVKSGDAMQQVLDALRASASPSPHQ